MYILDCTVFFILNLSIDWFRFGNDILFSITAFLKGLRWEKPLEVRISRVLLFFWTNSRSKCLALTFNVCDWKWSMKGQFVFRALTTVLYFEKKKNKAKKDDLYDLSQRHKWRFRMTCLFRTHYRPPLFICSTKKKITFFFVFILFFSMWIYMSMWLSCF